MIALVDMNCFYAAIEQADNKQWQHQPVAVTNGKIGTTIITCSYEARAYGITTGMRMQQARQYCPSLIQAPARPERYAEVSTRIMAALQQLSPEFEVYSVDEAFIDMTKQQALFASPKQVVSHIHACVNEAAGLPCSVGLSGDKTTAKFAAKQHKPNGMTVIRPENAATILAPFPVTALSGINRGIAAFLAQHGVTYCGQMRQIPMSLLAKKYGAIGRRVWLMAQGKDPLPVSSQPSVTKTMSHGKNLPPNTRQIAVIWTYFQHMAEKLAARLRAQQCKAKKGYISFKLRPQGWVDKKWSLAYPTDDGKRLFQLAQKMLAQSWRGQGVWQVRIVATELIFEQQADLFDATVEHNERNEINQLMDQINARYGELTIAPSRLVKRSTMPNVITPTWRPG